MYRSRAEVAMHAGMTEDWEAAAAKATQEAMVLRQGSWSLFEALATAMDRFAPLMKAPMRSMSSQGLGGS